MRAFQYVENIHFGSTDWPRLAKGQADRNDRSIPKRDSQFQAGALSSPCTNNTAIVSLAVGNDTATSLIAYISLKPANMCAGIRAASELFGAHNEHLYNYTSL